MPSIPAAKHVHHFLSGVLVVSVAWLTPFSSYAQHASPPPSHVLAEGEDLTYNVSYGPFDLGEVKISIERKVETPGYLAYFGTALIRSYKGVPFVDLHAVYESTIDTGVFSRAFVGKSREDNVWDFARYTFEYDKNRVLMEMGRRDTIVERRDTLPVEVHSHDGLSLFFYARDQLFSGKRMNIPAVVKEKKGNTYIDFRGERKSVEIDVVDYPIDVIGFDGTAEFVGIFGLTGDFEGWFSNDDARVPIVAKMKVILGSVRLELIRWKRTGWIPPRGE